MNSEILSLNCLMMLLYSISNGVNAYTSEGSICNSNLNQNGGNQMDCKCLPHINTLLVQNVSITFGNSTIKMDNSTTHLKLSGCSEVHLSGLTIVSLGSLHTLELHDISEIHFEADFFNRYNSQLQILDIQNSNFSSFESSLIISARKFRQITVNKMTFDEQFDLSIRTEEGQILDLIEIKNSKIHTLGEINISSRSVHQFTLENNIFDDILPGAILLRSNTTVIQGNTIKNLSLLSIDIQTLHFILKENTFTDLVLQGIVIQNATSIHIVGNIFLNVQEYGFVFMRPKPDNSSVTIIGNHFYGYEHGSLIFYDTVYNEHLNINLNAIHTETCNCNALEIIEDMTEGHNKTTKDLHQNRYMTYQLFWESSVCIDKNDKDKSVLRLCYDLASQSRKWIPTMIGITTLVILTALIAIFIHKKRNGSKQEWSLRNKIPTPYTTYDVNLGYSDDSDNEEYVRK